MVKLYGHIQISQRSLLQGESHFLLCCFFLLNILKCFSALMLTACLILMRINVLTLFPDLVKCPDICSVSASVCSLNVFTLVPGLFTL